MCHGGGQEVNTWPTHAADSRGRGEWGICEGEIMMRWRDGQNNGAGKIKAVNDVAMMGRVILHKLPWGALWCLHNSKACMADRRYHDNCACWVNNLISSVIFLHELLQ